MWSVRNVLCNDPSDALVLYNVSANSSNRSQTFPDKIPYSTKQRAGLILWADHILSLELSHFLLRGEMTLAKLDFER